MHEEDGFKFILVCFDIGSHRLAAFPLKNKSAIETRKVFEETFAYMHGSPDVLER